MAIITDFGMARIKDQVESSKTTVQMVGPIKWMSPESLFNRKYSKKSDVYSFGVVIFEIVTQHDPWEGKFLL